MVGLMVLAACGDNDENLPAGAEPPEFNPGCVNLPGNVDSYSQASDFEPLVRKTLADWDPTGRWFVTRGRVSYWANLHLERLGKEVVRDRRSQYPGRIDDDEVFIRQPLVTGDGEPNPITTRISNLRADGSARIEQAACDTDGCTVCTAVIERAAYNAGEGESDHLSLVGEIALPSDTPVHTVNVRMVGTVAYVVRLDGLFIVETVDPAHPVVLGSWHRTGDRYSNDVKLVEANGRRYALLADSPVDVVDVTDASQAHLVAQVPVEAHTLFTETRDGHTYAYFGALDGTTPVFDISNPEAPQRLGAFDAKATYVHDLMVDNGIAYLNAWEEGFKVVDFTNPSQPLQIGEWKRGLLDENYSHSSWAMHVGGQTVALHGDENWGAHLNVIDVDPASSRFMKPIGRYETRTYVSIHNVMAVGTKAYMTYYQDGVRVLDMQEPTRPKLVGYFNSWDPQGERSTNGFFEGAVGLDVDPIRKLIFVADTPRGLLILRDETP